MRNANRLFGFLLGVAVLWGCCGAAHAVTPMVSAGSSQTFALKSNGTLLAFGDNTSGQLGFGRLTQSSEPVQVVGLKQCSALAAGDSHTLVLNTDGTVWAWGDNSAGQLGDGTTILHSKPALVLGLTGVSIVAAGGNHSLALKQDGTVWAWGNNSSGQLGDGTTISRSTHVQVNGLSNISAIDTADDFYASHSIALKQDGTVWAWGENGAGELGDGTTTSRSTPAPVPGLTGVVAIAAGGGAADGGGGHTVVLKQDGTVWTWGNNGQGQLGDGTNIGRHTPVQVKGLSGVTAITAGYLYTLALKSDGTVWVWGWNGFGLLGNGTGIDSNTPVHVNGLTGIVTIVAGGVFNFALRQDGTAWAWGDNSFGQLGDGSKIQRLSPVVATNVTHVFAIAAGYMHTVALKQDGTVWAWGGNSNGQLGDGSAPTRSTPAPVPGMTDVSVIATANDFFASHSVALKQDGTVWAWGENGAGELGDGTATSRATPAPVPGLTGVAAIAAGGGAADGGGGHTVALKQDGTVWTWGNNWAGQLGDGTNIGRHAPVQVRGLSGVTAITAGYLYTLALKSDGTVWAWGWNGFGQLGNGTGIDSKTPVQINGLTGIVAVVAGSTHNLALRQDGTVWAWGENAFGRLGDGTTIGRSTPVQVNGLTGVSTVAVGDYHSMALRMDGTVWAWGDNAFGQLGDGTTIERHTPVQVNGLTGVNSIAAGSHSVALRMDGTILAWGANLSGQLGDGTLAQRLSPVLVVNTSADGFLNLNTGSVIIPPPELQVPFFVSSSGGITDTSATVSTTTKFNTTDLGKSGAVFVTAMVPSNSPLALSASNVSRAKALAASAANTFVQIQLTATGWQQVIGGQLIPLASGVLGELLAAQTILNGQDTTNLKGAQFCVGYGTSAAEMIATGKMRVVATIPTDPGATVAVSCVITGSSGATGFVVEFYKADINHYFMTASSDEAVSLDNKPEWNWARTGKAFNVWLTQSSAPSNASPVCRFYGLFANGTVGSHFYTVDPGECEYVKGRLDWSWASGYEGYAFYAVKPTGGACPAGTAPVYRVFNNGMGGAPNHRYMTNQTDVDTMVSQGWVSEGTAFCGAQ